MVTPAPTPEVTEEPLETDPPTLPPSTVIAFGATDAAWEATHQADTRFTPGCCYDAGPGYGDDDRFNDRYYGVIHDDGHVWDYSMRFIRGTSLGDAKAEVLLTEFPPDAKVMWSKSFATCAMVGIHSRTLGKDQAVVAFTSSADGPLRTSSIREATLLWYPGTKRPDVEC